MTAENKCSSCPKRKYPEREIYIIGGSPCSGKSSIAEMLAAEFDFYYHKEDDFLEQHMAAVCAANSASVSASRNQLSWAEAWQRDPKLQSVEEIAIYQEIFPYVLGELAAIPGKQSVISEAAAFMPELVYRLGVHPSHYIAIIPTAEFQRKEYEKRDWIGYFLQDSPNPEQAFDNWMQRDILFAEAVREQAEKCGYRYLLVDGKSSLKENYQLVKEHFMLTIEE